MAAGSELVNWMALLMTVSGFPSYRTLTVTLNGVPAVALEGAVRERVACVVAHPSEINSTLIVSKGPTDRIQCGPQCSLRDPFPLFMQMVSGAEEQFGPSS
jgi:hypothetical protein